MKRLIVRLSSLGDLILATSALEVMSKGDLCHWATSKDYRELLIGHPKINHLILFDRATGSIGWRHFCRQLWEAEYDEILDLHRTLRTAVMRLLFLFWNLKYRITSGKKKTDRKPPARWKAISKQRFRLYGYFIFKGVWPKKLRPTPWVNRFSEIVNTQKPPGPDFSHLLNKSSFPSELQAFLAAQHAQHPNRPYLCVMPSSKWPGKNWPTEYYLEVLEKGPYLPVILGSASDLASIHLAAALARKQRVYYSGIGKWSLSESAQVLSRSVGYLGGDTGFAHLAESLGKPSSVLYGPTTADMGFGPRLAKSKAIEAPLWCRPCGKDGRSCFRVFDRYRCQRELEPDRVLSSFPMESV